MTAQFQIEFDRIRKAAIPKRASQVMTGMMGSGNGAMTKWQEAKIRRELSKSKARTQKHVSMVKARYETIKTYVYTLNHNIYRDVDITRKHEHRYKVLCEKLMTLVGAENRDQLKEKLIDGENRNFTLINEINEEELELRYLRKEIAERKLDLEEILKTEKEYENHRADENRPHEDVKTMLQHRLERKQEELLSLISTIEKLEEFLQIFQDTTKKMYVAVMKDVELAPTECEPLKLTSTGNLHTYGHDCMGMPTVNVDFWKNMNYRELPPSLLTAAIDIVNVQLINRVCNFVSRANKEGTSRNDDMFEKKN